MHKALDQTYISHLEPNKIAKAPFTFYVVALKLKETTEIVMK